MKHTGIELTLAIDGEDVPLTSVGSPFIQIDTATNFGIPICHLELADQTGVIRKKVGDGTLFTIALGTSKSDITEYEFRLTKPIIGNNSVCLRGYLNHPRYLIEVPKKPIKGNASDVFNQCCQRVGLNPMIATTKDSMIWSPTNTNWLNFLRHVGLRSYMSDSSVVYGAITLDGSMIVRDINKARQAIAIFGGTDGTNPLLEMIPASVSTSNLFGGYKEEGTQQSLILPSDKVTKFDSIEVNSSSINRHPRMANYVDKGNTKVFHNIHKNNMHENYHKAAYNNVRGGKLFTRFVDISYQFKTSVNPLDVVKLQTANNCSPSEVIRKDTSFDDKDWTVLTKGIVVQGWKYYERMRLMAYDSPELAYRQ